MGRLLAYCTSRLRSPSHRPREVPAAHQLPPLGHNPVIRTIQDTTPGSRDDGEPQHTPQQSPYVFQQRSLEGPAARPSKGPRRPFPSFQSDDLGPTARKAIKHRVFFRGELRKELGLLERALFSSHTIHYLVDRVSKAIRVLSENPGPSADAKREDGANMFAEAQVTANRVRRRTRKVVETLVAELKRMDPEKFKQTEKTARRQRIEAAELLRREAAELEQREGSDAAETKRGDSAGGGAHPHSR